MKAPTRPIPSINQFENIVRYLKNASARRPVLENTLPLTIAITGARISEVLAMTTVDLDFDRNQVYIVTLKRRSPVKRTVPVPTWYLSIMNNYIVRNAIGYRLFPISRTQAWRIVKKKTGYHPHAFRHAYGMYLLYHGYDIETVRRILGHSTWSMVEYYVSVVGVSAGRGHPLELL